MNANHLTAEGHQEAKMETGGPDQRKIRPYFLNADEVSRLKNSHKLQGKIIQKSRTKICSSKLKIKLVQPYLQSLG